MAISDKLTYLNDTKTQLKDMINYGLDTGEKITSETTFRNYVKSLFDAFIKTMTYPDVLYNNLPKITGEGTSVTLNDTVYAPMRVELSPSALEQETTTGKNLIAPSYIINGAWIDNGQIRNNTGYTNTDSTKYRIIRIPNLPAGTYTFSINWNDTARMLRIYRDGATETVSVDLVNNTYTFTTTTDGLFALNFRNTTTTDFSDDDYTVQLEAGGTATSWEEYTGGQPSPNPQYPQQIHTISGENTITISNSDNTQSQTYSLSLGDLEYCKIGNYEDLFFKNVVGSEYYDSTLELDKWYLKKRVNKQIFNGTESWWLQSGTTSQMRVGLQYSSLYGSNLFSNYFIKATNNSDTTLNRAFLYSDSYLKIETEYTNAVDFKTWLSTHNTIFYYPLKNAIDILLNSTLQTQLEAIWKANSYEEQTNVSQTNNDLPFVLSLSAIEDLG